MITIEPTRELAVNAINDPVDREKRAYSRYKRDDIFVSARKKTLFFDQPTFDLQLRDVSLFGISVSIPRKIRRGSRLQLTVSFQDRSEYVLQGRVVHARDSDDAPVYGLKFERNNTSFMEHLLRTGVRKKLGQSC